METDSNCTSGHKKNDMNNYWGKRGSYPCSGY